jgi:hypothetical protein
MMMHRVAAALTGLSNPALSGVRHVANQNHSSLAPKPVARTSVIVGIAFA